MRIRTLALALALGCGLTSMASAKDPRIKVAKHRNTARARAVKHPKSPKIQQGKAARSRMLKNRAR
jgi:hypothetical protein